MPKLPNATANEVIKALPKIGFQIVRQRGSYVRLKNEHNLAVTVPVHSGKTLGRGLLRKILRDAEDAIDEYMSLKDRLTNFDNIPRKK